MSDLKLTVNDRFSDEIHPENPFKIPHRKSLYIRYDEHAVNGKFQDASKVPMDVYGCSDTLEYEDTVKRVIED